MYVIGTAGHVDHGKSALVRALTGIDPDRLVEERERGLTIDLGFAWLTLPSGREVSIVDVPGHERFIKNMLAGAGGVDLALLVIAADEGPMPQTREHLAILDRLDVPAGITVITKTDLVDGEYLELVRLEVADALEASAMADAPVVAVSARAGSGLDQLVAAIDAALDSVPEKRDLQRPRLPIDRAFTIQGFGTVVTGTLLDGTLRTGMQVELQPGGRRARIRGLQRHRSTVESLEPGTRAAVNLTGIDAGDVERGMVVAAPGSLSPVFALDARLTGAASARHPLTHDAVVTFLAGTAETEARVRLLDADAIAAGESCWAQLVLVDEVAVLPGDRCILRSPNETVAGGPIVAVNPRRHRRFHAATIHSLQRSLEGTPSSRLFDLLAMGPVRRIDIGSSLGLEPRAAEKIVEDLLADSRAVEVGGRVYGLSWLEIRAGQLEAVVSSFLDAHRLRVSVPREHVRSQVGLDAGDFEVVLGHATSRGLVEMASGGNLRTTGHTVTLPESVAADVRRFSDALRLDPYSPPTTGVPASEILDYMEGAGLVVQTRAGVVFDAAAFESMRDKALARAGASGKVTLAEVRDMFGTSRKYAQAFLEHLDELKLTRRVGDARVIREG